MRWVGLIVVGILAACGENQNLVAAQHSAYNVDRAVVFREVVAYMKERGAVAHWDNATRNAHVKDELEQDERAGTISTNWHLVGTRNAGAKEPAIVAGEYIRFDIAITGGPPWRVQVISHGGEMMSGSRLMSGVDSGTDWVDAATNRVIADIYRRLAPYAVTVDEPAAASAIR